MTNAPIRIVVLLSVLSLAGIIATQVYWANRAISSQEQQFNHSVQMALRNVVESLCEIDGNDFPSSDPIEQVANNYFVVHTKNRIKPGNLEYLLKAELQKRSIDQNFEYGVYDCQTDQMVYGNFVSLVVGEEPMDNAELVAKKAYVEQAFYNSTIRAIKMHLLIDETVNLGMDLPYTAFTFSDGMDIDEEMEKTAKLLTGKYITIQFKGEKGEEPIWEL